ncbi:MAG: ADP-ribosyltransferase [Dermatophilaceae bacterium]
MSGGGWSSPRLSEDLQFKVVSGPQDYASKTAASVEYMKVGSEDGVLGYLWAADADGAAGYEASPSGDDDAENAGMPWVLRLREAKAEGLTPTQALERMEAHPGSPDGGRVIAGSRNRAESLAALRELANEGADPGLRGRGRRTRGDDERAASGGGRSRVAGRHTGVEANEPHEGVATREPSVSRPTYREVNGVLRGSMLPTPEVMKQIDALDAALAGRPAREYIWVNRGMRLGPDDMPPPMMIGKTFGDPTYLSTTLGPPAPMFQHHEAILHLVVPTGTPALWMANVAADPGERELLLGRGLTYRIDRVAMENGQWQIYGRIHEQGATETSTAQETT